MGEYEAAVNAFMSTPGFVCECSPKHIRIGYQYREFESFWAIIKSDSFWATDARFSNDAQEQRFAADIFANQLQQGAEVLAGLNEDYIVCFCAEDDKLSQWRGHAAKGGVSMGFDFDGAIPFHIPLAEKALTPTMPAADYRTVFAQYGKVLYVEPRREGETDEEYYTDRYSQISNTALQKGAVKDVPQNFWNDLKKVHPLSSTKGLKRKTSGGWCSAMRTIACPPAYAIAPRMMKGFAVFILWFAPATRCPTEGGVWSACVWMVESPKSYSVASGQK